MKYECIEADRYRVYLCNNYKYNKENIKEELLKILQKLKKVYHFEIYAIFHIDCYIDDDYGIILEINKDSSPFFLYSKKTDIKLKIHDNYKFLYEIVDYFIKNKVNCNIYIVDNKLYLELKDDYMKISECIENIIYKEDDIEYIKNSIEKI